MILYLKIYPDERFPPIILDTAKTDLRQQVKKYNKATGANQTVYHLEMLFREYDEFVRLVNLGSRSFDYVLRNALGNFVRATFKGLQI